MKIPKTWADVSVFQWQQLVELFLKNDPDIDLETLTMSIVCDATETELLSLPYAKYNEILKQISFVHEQPEAIPQKHIKANGKRYKCVYDVRNIKAARYIESKHFAMDVPNNIHRIAASMVQPQTKVLGFWRNDKYDAAKHEEYANDLLSAPITAVYGSIVFFCKVYRNSIANLKGYLIEEMMAKGMSREEAEEVHKVLCNPLGGITSVHW